MLAVCRTISAAIHTDIIKSEHIKKEHPTFGCSFDIDRLGIVLNFSCGLLLPILLRLADVGLVAELGHLLGLGEEFLGLVGISLLH